MYQPTPPYCVLKWDLHLLKLKKECQYKIDRWPKVYTDNSSIVTEVLTHSNTALRDVTHQMLAYRMVRQIVI